MENRRVAKIDSLKKRKVREEHGEEAAPKGVTNTIESMRVKDETIVTDADDEEIKGEQSIDEFASYFNNETTPRILLTTNRRPKGVSKAKLNFKRMTYSLLVLYRNSLTSLKRSSQRSLVLNTTSERIIRLRT